MWCGNVTFLSPNKKVTKEVGIGEELSSLLPHSKPSLPYVPLPRALTMVQHALPATGGKPTCEDNAA